MKGTQELPLYSEQHISVIFKATNSGVRLSGFESKYYHLVAVAVAVIYCGKLFNNSMLH